jgi:arsenical pump membrane protein
MSPLLEALDRLPAVLGFLAAATALSCLAQAAGVFDLAAHGCLVLARGSRRRLFLLVALLASATTAILSLDTSAVLLTPVVLGACRAARVPARPFALLVLWLCAGASLFLPVSNLTSLLAAQKLGLTPGEFARQLAPAGAAASVVMVGLLAVLSRRELTGGFTRPGREPAPDPVLLGVGIATTAALVPALLLGVPPWLAASLAAAVLALGTLLRRRVLLHPSAWIPWRTLILAVLLVSAVSSLDVLGATLLRDAGTAGTALIAAGAANTVDNIPAYLLLERSGGDPIALLIGVNLGCLITPWGSLATLLWRDRCAAAGEALPWRSIVWGNTAASLLAVTTAIGVYHWT